MRHNYFLIYINLERKSDFLYLWDLCFPALQLYYFPYFWCFRISIIRMSRLVIVGSTLQYTIKRSGWQGSVGTEVISQWVLRFRKILVWHCGVSLRRVHVFFYKHSVFQSEARICLNFSQIQPQNMLKICLAKNIEKRKFHHLTHAWRVWVGRGYHNEENFEICTF